MMHRRTAGRGKESCGTCKRWSASLVQTAKQALQYSAQELQMMRLQACARRGSLMWPPAQAAPLTEAQATQRQKTADGSPPPTAACASQPPAAMMRAVSLSFSGRWSSVRGMAA